MAIYVSLPEGNFELPSGELTVCNGKLPSRNSGFSHEKLGDFPLLCERSPEGNNRNS